MNKVILLGNLTRDPETRYTPSGAAVANFGLANNRKWKNEQGETQEEVTFVDVTLWGKTAELAGKFLSKGSRILLEGRIKMESWEDKQTGQKRQKLIVVGETVTFLSGNKEGGDSGQKQPAASEKPRQTYQRPQQRPAPQQEQTHADGMEDDDIPF